MMVMLEFFFFPAFFFFREGVSHGIAAHMRSNPALNHGIAAYTCLYATYSGFGNHVLHPHVLPPLP